MKWLQCFPLLAAVILLFVCVFLGCGEGVGVPEPGADVGQEEPGPTGEQPETPDSGVDQEGTE